MEEGSAKKRQRNAEREVGPYHCGGRRQRSGHNDRCCCCCLCPLLIHLQQMKKQASACGEDKSQLDNTSRLYCCSCTLPCPLPNYLQEGTCISNGKDENPWAMHHKSTAAAAAATTISCAITCKKENVFTDISKRSRAKFPPLKARYLCALLFRVHTSWMDLVHNFSHRKHDTRANFSCKRTHLEWIFRFLFGITPWYTCVLVCLWQKRVLLEDCLVQQILNEDSRIVNWFLTNQSHILLEPRQDTSADESTSNKKVKRDSHVCCCLVKHNLDEDSRKWYERGVVSWENGIIRKLITRK